MPRNTRYIQRLFGIFPIEKLNIVFFSFKDILTFGNYFKYLKLVIENTRYRETLRFQVLTPPKHGRVLGLTYIKFSRGFFGYLVYVPRNILREHIPRNVKFGIVGGFKGAAFLLQKKQIYTCLSKTAFWNIPLYRTDRYVSHGEKSL